MISIFSNMWSPVLFLLSIAGITSAQKKLWEKCNGQSWSDTGKCVSGASCIYQDTEDSRCFQGTFSKEERNQRAMLNRAALSIESRH